MPSTSYTASLALSPRAHAPTSQHPRVNFPQSSTRYSMPQQTYGYTQPPDQGLHNTQQRSQSSPGTRPVNTFCSTTSFTTYVDKNGRSVTVPGGGTDPFKTHPVDSAMSYYSEGATSVRSDPGGPTHGGNRAESENSSVGGDHARSRPSREAQPQHPSSSKSVGDEGYLSNASPASATASRVPLGKVAPGMSLSSVILPDAGLESNFKVDERSKQRDAATGGRDEILVDSSAQTSFTGMILEHANSPTKAADESTDVISSVTPKSSHPGITDRRRVASPTSPEITIISSKELQPNPESEVFEARQTRHVPFSQPLTPKVIIDPPPPVAAALEQSTSAGANQSVGRPPGRTVTSKKSSKGLKVGSETGKNKPSTSSTRSSTSNRHSKAAIGSKNVNVAVDLVTPTRSSFLVEPSQIPPSMDGPYTKRPAMAPLHGTEKSPRSLTRTLERLLKEADGSLFNPTPTGDFRTGADHNKGWFF